MIVAPAKPELISQLRSYSPRNKNTTSATNFRYPKEFKSLVIEALGQGISVAQIADVTGLKRSTIYEWRRSKKEDSPVVRKLKVVSDAPHKHRKSMTIKIGSKVTFEIDPDDLTADFLVKLAGI